MVEGGELSEVVLAKTPETGADIGALAAEALEGVERGEDLGYQVEIRGEELAKAWSEDLHRVGEGADGLLARLGDIGEGLKEVAHEVLEGLEHVLEAVGHGIEWLQAHPEVIRAGAELVILGAMFVENPEMVAAYLADHPDVLADPIRTIVEAL